MKRRALYAAGSLALLALAWWLPTGWYDSLARQPDTPPLPFRGVTLLRFTFLVEALLLGVLALVDWRPRPLPPAERLDLRKPDDVPDDLTRSNALSLLVVITLIAIALRAYHIGSDLWLDEITPIVDYGHMPFAQVLGTYLRTNNHLLNTLLIKLSIGAFGESEWSVRLPAMLFGAATVPLFYWIGRLALSRWASVASALVLAVSYHHVFFSQNARGYSAYLFFGLLTSGVLIRALADDRGWRWCLYVVAIVLGFASLANMVFVLAAHVMLGAAAVVAVRTRGGSGLPLVRRLALVFGASGFLSFQLYAAPLPEMYAVISHLYVREATGFAPLSMEFLREVVRGVSAGFGGVLPTIVLLVLGAAGVSILFRASWLLTAALGLPPILTAVFLVARGLSFSPRFFLLLVPLTILAVMAAAEAPLSALLGRRQSRGVLHPRRAALLGAVLALASLASLPRYYRTPKQSYREALAYLERNHGPGDRVVVIYAAEGGFRYYATRVGVKAPEDYKYARTLSGFDSLVGAPNGNVVVVTTFPRVLRADLPALAERIERNWKPQRAFAGTIGDGDITVWTRKPHCNTPNCG